MLGRPHDRRYRTSSDTSRLARFDQLGWVDDHHLRVGHGRRPADRRQVLHPVRSSTRLPLRHRPLHGGIAALRVRDRHLRVDLLPGGSGDWCRGAPAVCGGADRGSLRQGSRPGHRHVRRGLFGRAGRRADLRWPARGLSLLALDLLRQRSDRRRARRIDDAVHPGVSRPSTPRRPTSSGCC